MINKEKIFLHLNFVYFLQKYWIIGVFMQDDRLIFAQIMDYVPRYEFSKCVKRYDGDYKVQKYTSWQHYLLMSFAQLTYRDSLRDVITCLTAVDSKLYRMGFRTTPVLSTISEANKHRDYRIYSDFAQVLISLARDLYNEEPNILNIKEAVYALDSSTIDLCLSMFPWARFRKHKAAVKLHTLLNLKGNIPSFIKITDGKVHDVNILDIIPYEPGSFYVVDRGYLDYVRLYRLHQSFCYFVIRAKTNTQTQRIYSHPIDKVTGLRYDQTVKLTGFYTQKDYPDHLRQIKYRDPETDKELIFLTNNFDLPALTITQLYKNRWQIELFFKWVKQHLRIKSFYGTSENAVKSQIWIAVTVYVLVAIIKKQLKIEHSLYTILQILSISILEKSSIYQLLTDVKYRSDDGSIYKQLELFNL